MLYTIFPLCFYLLIASELQQGKGFIHVRISRLKKLDLGVLQHTLIFSIHLGTHSKKNIVYKNAKGENR